MKFFNFFLFSLKNRLQFVEIRGMMYSYDYVSARASTPLRVNNPSVF